MIVQCEQCSTKFRLDDAKVPESGVKVRCAKCRHIFVVQREPARDEPDMDSFLQGLGGAGIAAASEVAAPPSAPGPSVEVDPDLMRTLAAAQEQEDAADEFSFEVTPPPVSAPTEGKEDFQEFEFDIAAPPPAVATGGTSPPESSPFQEFSFELPGVSPDESATVTPAAAPAHLDISVDADEFSFGVTPPAASEGSQFSAELLPDLPADETDGFAFGEQPMAASSPQVAPGSSFGATPAVDLPAAVTGETFGFGETPDSTLEAGPSASWDHPDSRTTFEVPPPESLVADAGQFTFSPPPASTPADPSAKTDADLRAMILGGEGREQKGADFASDSFVFDTGEQSGADGDELPPLTISSRKVGGGAFGKVVLLFILLLLAAGGGGWWYVQQNGIAGLEGVLAAVGVDTTPRFELRSVTAGYLKNSEGVDLFVVRGEVRNLSRFGRGEIQLRAMIYGPGGKPLARKVAFAGNPLPDSRLATLPFADVEKAMSNRLGDTLDNMEVRQDEVIPFAVVFNTLPAEAVDYGVEVAGSVMAGKKQ